MTHNQSVSDTPAPARPGSIRDRFERWALTCSDIKNIDLDAIAYDPIDPDCHWIEGYYDPFTDGAYTAFKAIDKGRAEAEARKRDHFEEWAKMPARNWSTAREKGGSFYRGEYIEKHVQSAWEAWQSALLLERSENNSTGE